jgi:hypothetical protein
MFLAILVLEERVVFSPFGAPDNSGLVIAEAPASLFLFSELLHQRNQFGKVFLSQERSSAGGTRGSNKFGNFAKMSCNLGW